MRHALFLILLLGLSAPVCAQVVDLHAPPGLPQIVVTPEYPDLLAAPEQPELDMNLVSELFPNGAPNLLTPESMARQYKLPASVPAPDAKKKIPTAINYTEGPMKFDVGTNVTTMTTVTTIVPPPMPDPIALSGATGGSGEIKGGVRYVGEQWELYGMQSVGVGHADGFGPSHQETTTFGTLFKLPSTVAGGKIGASFEVNALDERRTRIEYRQSFGPAEGFVAAEQTFLPMPTEHKPPASVRGGVNRKF